MRAVIRKRIYFSLLLSLFAHVGFMVWSFFVHVVPNAYVVQPPEKFIHVKITNEEKLRHDAPQSKVNASEKTAQPENPFAQTKTLEPSIESQEAVKDNIASAVQRNDEPPAISSTPAQLLKKPQMTDLVVTKKVRRSDRRNLVEVGEVPHEEFASGAPIIISGEDISPNFLDKGNIAVKTAPAAPVQAANGQREFQIMQKSSWGVSRKSKAVDSGTTLAYELYKYQDPQSGQKYFKLLVKVRDATMNFPVIPKEIIFLVDASQSIGATRLAQFQEAVLYSLNHLNKDDFFNIIIFKAKTIPLSEVSLRAQPENIKKAAAFLAELKSGATTDVYNAVQMSLNTKTPFTPSYRVLLSDGFPTRGIINSRQVINEVSKINNGKVSIFAFGGGVSISRYMLDFVAYKNRGWSRFTDRDYAISKEVAKLYDEIRDPLLLHLRYHVSGLNGKEVFPQNLPDFFKGSEFVIYGTYGMEDRFFVQVLGDALGQTKEFIVNDALTNALPGDKDIARQWAFHKIYHLIGQLKYKENNEAIINEINALCAKYNIVTPYSKNLERKHPPN